MEESLEARGNDRVQTLPHRAVMNSAREEQPLLAGPGLACRGTHRRQRGLAWVTMNRRKMIWKQRTWKDSFPPKRDWPRIDIGLAKRWASHCCKPGAGRGFTDSSGGLNAEKVVFRGICPRELRTAGLIPRGPPCGFARSHARPGEAQPQVRGSFWGSWRVVG